MEEKRKTGSKKRSLFTREGAGKVGWFSGLMEEGAGEETPVSGPSRWELYEILGLESKEVTLDELRSKRKRLALRYHPDRNRDDESAQVGSPPTSNALPPLTSPFLHIAKNATSQSRL